MQPRYTTKVNLCPYEGFGSMGGARAPVSAPRTSFSNMGSHRFHGAGPNIPHAGPPTYYPGYTPYYPPPTYYPPPPTYYPPRPHHDTTWDPMFGLPSIIILFLCISLSIVALPKGA